MEHVKIKNEPSEMEIVDTFTKLIFGLEQDFSDTELAIIQVLRQVDHNIALDDQGEMGVYLRALGVSEMVSLVRRVRQNYPPQGQTPAPVLPRQRAQF
jgi:hypothetical protein